MYEILMKLIKRRREQLWKQGGSKKLPVPEKAAVLTLYQRGRKTASIYGPYQYSVGEDSTKVNYEVAIVHPIG